jgi:hypothetical protein
MAFLYVLHFSFSSWLISSQFSHLRVYLCYHFLAHPTEGLLMGHFVMGMQTLDAKQAIERVYRYSTAGMWQW